MLFVIKNWNLFILKSVLNKDDTMTNNKEDEAEYLFRLESVLIQSKNQKRQNWGCMAHLFQIALILFLIAIAVIAALSLISPTTGAVFSNIGPTLAGTPMP